MSDDGMDVVGSGNDSDMFDQDDDDSDIDGEPLPPQDPPAPSSTRAPHPPPPQTQPPPRPPPPTVRGFVSSFQIVDKLEPRAYVSSIISQDQHSSVANPANPNPGLTQQHSTLQQVRARPAHAGSA